MLTRGQVAKRLARSIATVRRIEGTLLHPRTDFRGIRRFDEAEVEALRQSVLRGQRLPNGLAGGRQTSVPEAGLIELRSRVAKLESTLCELIEMVCDD